MRLSIGVLTRVSTAWMRAPHERLCYAGGPMKVVSVGGGPAGLYFSILMKKAFPQTEISVYERNRPEDTFGWGVVFSRETLGNLEAADAESYREVSARFAYWDDIETHYGGRVVTSRGHGFCGLARRELLMILQQRAASLGVKLAFQHEVKTLEELPPADLILGADGVHSWVREALTAQLRPTIQWGKARFCWLGTTLPLKAFTFHFKQSPHGLFQVHAYPFNPTTSTWIVECHEDVWRRAGLENATEEQTVAFCEALFAQELKGHKLLPNKSIWRTFPTLSLERWFHRNVVMMGDAAHTAHFSIGSGTKLAMEDAIALAAAFREKGVADVPGALAAYEAARRPEVIRLQKAARTSLEWFENSARYVKQPPEQFSFNLMTRSRRITWENLRKRDAALVAEVDALISRQAGLDGAAPRPPAFTPYTVRGLTLPNRIVLSPMCQYLAKDGLPDAWHLVHLGSRAIGGAGLLLAEMTAVNPEARITPGCTGLWTDAQGAAWRKVVDFVHERSPAKIGIQLGHAGRKGSRQTPQDGDGLLRPGQWQTVGPGDEPFAPDWDSPRPLTPAELAALKGDYVAAARRALAAGFDWLELHFAHGYLVSSFLSPLTNRRTDGYGGSLEKRARLARELTVAVREVWPSHLPLSVKLSVTDWVGERGMTLEDSVLLSRWLKEDGADVIVPSSGFNVPAPLPEFGRMFQLPFAERLRYEADVPVMAVGGITSVDQVSTIVGAGRAELCAIARAHLTDPYLALHAADELGLGSAYWPEAYERRLPPQRPR